MSRKNEPEPPLYPPGLEGPPAWHDVSGEVEGLGGQGEGRTSSGTRSAGPDAAALEAQRLFLGQTSVAGRRACSFPFEKCAEPACAQRFGAHSDSMGLPSDL